MTICNFSGFLKITNWILRIRIFFRIFEILPPFSGKNDSFTSTSTASLFSFLPSKPVVQKPSEAEIQKKKAEDLKLRQEKEEEAQKRREELQKAKLEEKKLQREARTKRVLEARQVCAPLRSF